MLIIDISVIYFKNANNRRNNKNDIKLPYMKYPY